MTNFEIPIKLIILKRTYEPDIEDEDKIPKEYMKPNLIKIENDVRKSKGQKKIPGVKTHIVETVYVE